MKKLISIIGTISALLLVAVNGGAQAVKKETVAVKSNAIEVVQFHLEHRCVSCTNIEKFTKAALAANFPSIPFKLIAIEKKENTKLAEQFEASGTSLFLYNSKTGAKKNLTQFAFLNAGNEAKFQAGLKQELDAFQKQ